MTVETIAGQVRLPLGGGTPTLPDGGELIFEPTGWGDNGFIRMTIRSYGAPGHFGDQGAKTRNHSIVIPLSVLQTVIDHFKEDQ